MKTHTLTVSRRLLGAATLALTLSACVTVPANDPEQPLRAWVQYAPEGQVSMRAIVRAGQACPSVQAGDETLPMQLRAAPSGKGANSRQPFNANFNVAVCETEAAGFGQRVRIGEQQWRLPGDTPQRIVVIGDTGCQVKTAARDDAPPQNCRSGEEWPWARIAASAAALQPDLVIHTGDYHYREQCDDPGRCAALRVAGVAIGFGWDGWNADFFTPAAPLLAAAPWVFVRGNHENCDRGGEGWMRFLAPQEYVACARQHYRTDSRSRLETNHTAPGYHVDLGPDLGLVVLDTGAHEDWRPAEEVPEDVNLLRRHLAALSHADHAQRLWLLTHKPIWHDLLKPEMPATALQAATRNALPENLELVLSGHVHAFSTLNFDPRADHEQYPTGRPAQVIVGASGTRLEAQDPKSPWFEGRQPGSKERKQASAHVHDGIQGSSGLQLNRFTFLLLERDEADWVGHIMDADGHKLSSCRLAAGSKQMRCAFPN